MSWIVTVYSWLCKWSQVKKRQLIVGFLDRCFCMFYDFKKVYLTAFPSIHNIIMNDGMTCEI